MKTIHSCLVLLFCVLLQASFSQTVNWTALKEEQRHMISVNTGWEYGLVYGASYGFKLKSKIPVLLNASYSAPSGKNLTDDLKWKAGGQMRLWKIRQFHLSGSVQGIYRRYGNPLVNLQNIGAELSLVAGYYTTRWHAAIELGYDKAMFTHFKHTQMFKDFIYANVQDGWYRSPGTNLFAGIQLAYSLRKNDIIAKIGRITTPDLKSAPLVPYYVQLGVNFRF